MSRSNSDDDVTTDAIPSPPRDEVKENREEEVEEDVKTHSTTRPGFTNSYKKAKSKGFTKTRKTSPAAIASVINISNANGIHIGSNYTVNINNTSKNNTKNEYVVTQAIQSLFESTELVNTKHLRFISPHLNEDWRSTARMLDYSDGQISQFYEDYIRSGIKEVIYQLLLDWIQNEATSATVGKLSNVLWQTNQQDVVQRWAKDLKQ